MNQFSEELKGYAKIDNFTDVAIGTRIKYTMDDTEETILCKGGKLTGKDHANQYIMLANGLSGWSVPIDGSFFFRKMTRAEEMEELHSFYKKKSEEKDQLFNELLLKNKQLVDQITHLEYMPGGKGYTEAKQEFESAV